MVPEFVPYVVGSCRKSGDWLGILAHRTREFEHMCARGCISIVVQ